MWCPWCPPAPWYRYIFLESNQRYIFTNANFPLGLFDYWPLRLTLENLLKIVTPRCPPEIRFILHEDEINQSLQENLWDFSPVQIDQQVGHFYGSGKITFTFYTMTNRDNPRWCTVYPVQCDMFVRIPSSPLGKRDLLQKALSTIMSCWNVLAMSKHHMCLTFLAHEKPSNILVWRPHIKKTILQTSSIKLSSQPTQNVPITLA